MKIYIAQYVDDNGDVEVLGVYAKREQAKETVCKKNNEFYENGEDAFCAMVYEWDVIEN